MKLQFANTLVMLLSVLNMVANTQLPATAQRGIDPFALNAMQARKAMIDGDLGTAENYWLAALQAFDSVKSTPLPYADPRYYYAERWLGTTMLLEKKAGAAEGILAPACSSSALLASLQDEDVRATIDVYAQVLRENGKPAAAREAIELWNSVVQKNNKPSSAALSTTPYALSTTSGSTTPSGMSGTPNAMSHTQRPFEQAEKKDIPVPPMPPSGILLY